MKTVLDRLTCALVRALFFPVAGGPVKPVTPPSPPSVHLNYEPLWVDDFPLVPSYLIAHEEEQRQLRRARRRVYAITMNAVPVNAHFAGAST